MNEWKKVVEDGQTYWLHEEYGNILELTNKTFVALKPSIIRFGPFKTIQAAQQSLEDKDNTLKDTLEALNQSLTFKE